MQENKTKKALFWFRRDLRLKDNAGLYHALKECDTVAPVFVFDKTILDELPAQDRRVEFIWNSILELRNQFRQFGSDIVVQYDYAEKIIPALAKKYQVDFVYTNEDYEPKARQRDGVIGEKLQESGIELKLYKDHVIFAKDELLTPQNQPYTVFSHYKLAWKKKLEAKDYQHYAVFNFYDKLAKFKGADMPELLDMGFRPTNLNEMKLVSGSEGAERLFERFKSKMIGHYKILRDVPYVPGVSYLSVHNRFGTISIRCLVEQVQKLIASASGSRKEGCEAWLDELIWRDFYIQLMYHYPHIAYEPFRSEFANFPWENNFTYFQAWCEGKTGFPIIDAAMIQLNRTGYMHNRLRMLSASFLTKDLLIDYRMGEDYFANKLLDFDLAANNGGWQWAASTGCDIQPYVRIFNPSRQSEKFDPDAKFIKKYLPQLAHVPSQYLHEPWKYEEELKEFNVRLGENYPYPIISHEERRQLAIKTYQNK